MPELNAALNFASAILLILGYLFIRRRAITAHKLCMLSATATSTIFLVCYIYYHIHHGSTRFRGAGVSRTVYFSILISHTILAVFVIPLITKTIYHAFRGEFPKHVRIARWTLGIWWYVSVTGVVVYWMLYRLA